MPIPTTTDDTPITPAKASQKNMTKAERRELQEKQRAVKAVSKQQQQPTQQQGKDPQSAPPKPQLPQTSKKDAQQQGKQPQQAGVGATKARPPGTPHRKSFLSETPWKGAPKDVNFLGAAEEPSSHGLRIFSHFGQPKPTAQVKGDIHPAIIRLGLMFSEFKICGANARCIATLTAFKQACYKVELS